MGVAIAEQAEADAACTQSTNLAGVYFAVLNGYQDELIAANQQTITQVKQAVQAQSAYLGTYPAGGGS